jgi:hypothetical protein
VLDYQELFYGAMEQSGCVNHGWVTFFFNRLQDINSVLLEKFFTISTIELDYLLCLLIERVFYA